MTKKELLTALSEKCCLTKSNVDSLLKELASIACKEAINGFTIPGICRIKVIEKDASRRRHPQNGMTMLIGKHKVVKLTILKQAKDAIAPKPADLVTVLPEPWVSARTLADSSPATAELPVTEMALPPMEQAEQRPLTPGDILFSCPQCGTTLSSEAGSEGIECQCPSCLCNLTVPQGEMPPADVSNIGGRDTLVGNDLSGFVAFVCDTCKQEIEAPLSMGGTATACPACGTRLLVPVSSTLTEKQVADPDIFSRTIRIDLLDLDSVPSHN